MFNADAKKFFTWDITYECNYRCTYCFLNFEPSMKSVKTVRLDPAGWIRIWEYIYNKYGQCHMQVTGGEPFVYPKFREIVAGLCDMHTMDFSTNLSWDVKEFSKKVSNERVKIDASFHPEHTNFTEFSRNLCFLRDEGYITGVTMVAYPPMLDTIIECIESFEKIGYKLIIYPYRGPYNGMFYPDEYNSEERKRLKNMNVDICEKVSENLIQTYVDTPMYPDKIEKKEALNAGSMLDRIADVQDTGKKADSSAPHNNRNVQKASCVSCNKGPAKKEERLCRMGMDYAKFYPDGSAYRCCAPIHEKSWGYLGNLFDGTFSLYDVPKLCPPHIQCKCYKAMVVGKERDWKRHWVDVVSLKKHAELESLLDEVKALRDQSKLEEATMLLNKSLQKYGDNPKVLTLLGELYVNKGDDNSALVVLEKSLNQNDMESQAWAYRVIGDIYFRQRQLDKALRNFTQSINSADEWGNVTDKAEACMGIWSISMVKGDFDTARKYLTKAIEKLPDHPHTRERIEAVFYDCSIQLRREGRSKEAFKLLNEYLKMDPHNARIRLEKARTYIDLDSSIEARSLLEDIIKDSDKLNLNEDIRSEIFRNLGDCNLKLGNYQAARDCLDKALMFLMDVKGGPNFGDREVGICRALGSVFMRQEMVDKAESFLQRALKAESVDDGVISQVWKDLGELYLKKENSSLAEEYIEKSMILSSKYGGDLEKSEVFAAKARMCVMLKDFKSAENHARAALALQPGKGNLVNLLKEIRESLSATKQ